MGGSEALSVAPDNYFKNMCYLLWNISALIIFSGTVS
jgi:hypothetical protein